MKRNIFSLAGPIMAFLINSYATSALPPGKIALIVAISDYPRETGWRPISSDNDVGLITNALKSQGFTDKNIVICQDASATRIGIEDAFKNLVEKANKGDVVVFHYSGHGQQIQDDNGDELDGYDEALVPYDAHLYYEKNMYEGQNHFRDDLLEQYLTRLRQKVGPGGNVLVILDACYSGTATRGMAMCRGTENAFQEPGYKPGLNRGRDMSFYENAEGKNLSPLVVFSASSDHELNYEYIEKETDRSYGSLSYAVSMVMKNMPGQMTYRGLFDEIKNEMAALAPKQTPQLEGDVDREIFGGKAVRQEKHFTVKRWLDSTRIRIDGGKLTGLTDSSTVAFYPIGTANPDISKPITSGTVVNTGALECEVIPDRPLDEKEALASWVFVRAINYGELTVKVKLDIRSDDLRKKFLEKLTACPSVRVVEKGENLLVEETDTRGSMLAVTTEKDLVVFPPENTGAMSQDQLLEGAFQALLAYPQAELLRTIDLKNPSLDVAFELIPVTVMKTKNGKTEDQRLPLSSKITSGNQLSFREGDRFKIKLTNTGNRLAYFNLLDIQPDNRINILIPPYDRKGRSLLTPEECKLMPGDSIIYSYIYFIFPPYGNEMFRLIASAEPFDLAPIAATRGGETPKGSSNPFATLFSRSYLDSKTRGGGLPSVPAGEVNIRTLVFRIIK